MKKLFAMLLSAAMVVSLCACGGADTATEATSETAAVEETAEATEEATAEATEPAETAEAVDAAGAADIKVGVIYIGDENEGYTEAHMKGIDAMQAALGLSEDQVIGHESYIMQAATEYPEVQFCHATGYQAAGSGLANMHNYFTAVYESRYVSGVVAGLKLNEMIEAGTITADQAKLGYVGAFPYAEVVSGYTSFFLGVRSVCPTATMEVQYTNSWADMSGEAEVAASLIADDCVLISQHADTTGAPSTCQTSCVP